MSKNKSTITLNKSEQSAAERQKAIQQQAKRKREAAAKIEMLNELAELSELFGDDRSAHSVSIFR